METEIAAQVRACLDRRLHPTRFDSTTRPHRVGYRSSSHHYGAPVWDTGDPIVTQLRPWDRFCPQVLQSVQHKVANIWPDEDPIFGSSVDVQEILAARSGDVELMVHLNSESTGSISDGRGHIEIERWFSTH